MDDTRLDRYDAMAGRAVTACRGPIPTWRPGETRQPRTVHTRRAVTLSNAAVAFRRSPLLRRFDGSSGVRVQRPRHRRVGVSVQVCFGDPHDIGRSDTGQVDAPYAARAASKMQLSTQRRRRSSPNMFAIRRYVFSSLSVSFLRPVPSVHQTTTMTTLLQTNANYPLHSRPSIHALPSTRVVPSIGRGIYAYRL